MSSLVGVATRARPISNNAQVGARRGEVSDERVQFVQQPLTLVLIVGASEVPGLLSNGVELVNTVGGAESHGSDAQSEVHAPAKDFEEGDALAEHELRDALRSKVDAIALRQDGDRFCTVAPFGPDGFRRPG